MKIMSNPTPITVDPEFAALIPPLQPAELAGLEASIRAEGCRDALVVWRGVLIDGHNRKTICERHGLPYQTRAIDLPDRTAAMLWIIDNQQHRRNLADIDKIALARKREELLRTKASENHAASIPKPGQCGFQSVRAKLPGHGNDHPTRRLAAASAGVGERTYDAGKLVLDAVAAGEVPETVLSDLRARKTAIHRVAKDIKETRAKSERKQQRMEATKAVALDERIIVGDFRKHADRIPDGSLSLIFTDPPYDREASKMLPDLAAFAARKLADGGSLIFYCGQTQLPDAIAAASRHLRYWWTACCLHAGRSTVMREYGVNAGWKPVLWFVKGTRDDNSVMVNDVMSGGEEKSHHDWQQSQAEAQYWIDKLTTKGQIVCDPFLGGGTTAAAAKLLGRKWVGFEIDEATARIAAGRVK